MVFGMISVASRTASVRTPEKMPTFASPNTTAACAPAIVAPTVCAIVFKVRIAAIGSSTFLRACSSHSPDHSPRFFKIAT
jgi:hypothetical protein